MSKQLGCLLFFVLCAIAPLTEGQVGGTFTVNCVPLTIQRSDPILFPGVVGAHTHNIIGGNAFQRKMSGMYDAQAANSTTCDKALDHSNYWVPSLYHQRADKQFELVPWRGSAVYYQKRACNFTEGLRRCDDNYVPLAFPYGFRMVAGDPMRRTQNDSDYAQKAVSMVCLGAGGDFKGFPTHTCDTLRAQVYFPSCWDGVNLDSPNHKSHVSYPAIGDYNGGVCPKSHPVALFSIFYEFFFETNTIKDFNRFAFANGDPTAFGYHGDFIMGWLDRDKLQHAHERCVTAANCPDLGFQPSERRPLIYPAIYEEEVGLTGPIPQLPGNNPVVFPK